MSLCDMHSELDYSKLSFIGMASGRVMILIATSYKNTRHCYYEIVN